MRNTLCREGAVAPQLFFFCCLSAFSPENRQCDTTPGTSIFYFRHWATVDIAHCQEGFVFQSKFILDVINEKNFLSFFLVFVSFDCIHLIFTPRIGA